MSQVCIPVQFSSALLQKYSQRIEINSSPLRKNLLEKIILKQKRGAKFQVAGERGVPMGRAGISVGKRFRNCGYFNTFLINTIVFAYIYCKKKRQNNTKVQI